MRGAIFFNPASGLRDPSLADALRQRGGEHDLDLIELRSGIDCRAVIRERIERGEKLFVAAGGDGTINNVIQGVAGTDAVLGVVPVGTWNHFAKDLRLPLEWDEALDVVFEGRTRQVDLARVNHHYFANNLSLGLYPEIVEHRERLRGSHSKWRAYAYATWSAFRKFPSVSLNVELPHRLDAIRSKVFAVAVNPYDLQRAGVLAPRVSLEAGRLSVYWIPDMAKTKFIRLLARYLRGRIETGEGFAKLQTTHLKVHSSRPLLRMGVDGELLEMKPPLHITIEPQSLLVRVPRAESARS